MTPPMEPDFSRLYPPPARSVFALPTLFGESIYPVLKPRVFVSYQHRHDQLWYQDFSRCFCDVYEVFDDTSPERAKDSEDTDYIMWSLRENHIKGSSCTIVLCGPETFKRKFVDWEIAATLDKKHALIGVCLPTCTINDLGKAVVPARLYDNIMSGYAGWITWQALAQGGPSFLREQIAFADAKPKSLIQNDRQKMGRCMQSLSSIFQRPPWLARMIPTLIAGQITI
jgi:hypothetical protein